MATATILLATFSSDASIGTAAWSNPGDAASSNDIKASASVSVSDTTQYLKGTAGSAGSIPSGSTINSVSAKVEGNRGARVFNEIDVVSVKADVIQSTQHLVTNAWTTVDTVYSYDLMSNGETYSVAQLNDAGFGFAIRLANQGIAPGSVNIDQMYVVVDYTASAGPAVTSFSPGSGCAGASVVITGTGFTGATSVKFGGVEATSFVVDSATQITAVVASTASGTVSVTTPGGTGTSSGSFTIIPAPAISSFTPASGKPGDSVVITGTNFTGATAVKFFNNVTASFTVDSATQITATVPAGAATGTLSVTTPCGTGTSGSIWTLIPAPTITSFTPSNGPTGTSVTINGTNLSNASSVKFGGTDATSFVVDSATQITAVVAAGTTGTISVVTPGGTATSGSTYTLTLTPTITSFSPASGKAGDTVVITGTNFVNVNWVRLSGVNFASYTVDSTTQITAILGANYDTGAITVNTGGGTATSATNFTFYKTPTITDVDDQAGFETETQDIYGTNFDNIVSVKFGTVNAASYTRVSATHITAVIPADAESGSIFVETLGGTANSANAVPTQLFTFKGNYPSITSFTPAFAKRGEEVVITGTGLTGLQACNIGTISSATATQITVVVGGIPNTDTDGSLLVKVWKDNDLGDPVEASSATVFEWVPSITSFVPTEGVYGDIIRINVVDFGDGTTSVRFNGTLGTMSGGSTNYQDIIVPVGATTGPISLTGTNGRTDTTIDDFTILFPPRNITFDPICGPEQAIVIITGTDFTDASVVAFGGEPCLSFTVDSDTQITAVVPIGALLGDVYVQTPNGFGTSGDNFTVLANLPFPVVTNLTDIGAQSTSPTTLTGYSSWNLETDVLAGDWSSAGVDSTVAPNTLADAINPVNDTTTLVSSTQYKMRWSAVGCGIRYYGPYTQFATTADQMVIESIAPTSGPYGTSVVITGRNFVNISDVKIGAVKVTFVVNSITQITCRAPRGGTVTVTGSLGTATGPLFTITGGGVPASPVIALDEFFYVNPQPRLKKVKITSMSFPSGAIPISVEVNWGDGSATEVRLVTYYSDGNDPVYAILGTNTFEHTYSLPGTYDVSAVVRDNANRSGIDIIQVVVAVLPSDLPTEPPPPVVVVTGATTVTVDTPNSLNASWDSLVFKYWRVSNPSVVTTIAVVPGVDIYLTSLIQDQPYLCIYTASNLYGNTDSDATPFTPSVTGGGGGGGNPGAPTAPGRVRDTDLQDVSVKIIMPAKPINADSLRLYMKLSADPDTSWVAIRVGLLGDDVVQISGLTASTNYSVKAASYNAYGIVDGPIHDFKTEAVGSGGEITLPPNTPTPPTSVKSCVTPSITMTTPEWDTTPGRQTASIELQRSSDAGTTWQDVYIWELPDDPDYEDLDVLDFGSYTYRCRGCNAVGCSSWSNATIAIVIISLTSTGLWDSPNVGAENLVGVVNLSYSFTDTIGDTSNHKVYANGRLISLPLELQSGDLQNGRMSRVWDTRREYQGNVTLRAEWLGSDGCIAFCEKSVSVLNTRLTGILYRDFKIAQTLPVGLEYHRAYPTVWSGPLDDAPSGRFWGQIAISTDTDLSPVTNAIDPASAQASFDSMQQVTMAPSREWSQIGATEPGSIVATLTGVSLVVPGQCLTVRLRQEPKVLMTPFETGSQTIPKIRDLGSGTYLVFAKDPDKAYIYDGTNLSLIVDITDSYGINTVDDFAILNDKVYFASVGILYAYDKDSTAPLNRRVLRMSPLGEVGNLKFLEILDDSLYAVYTDPVPGTLTQVYEIKADQFDPVWSFDNQVTSSYTDGNSLFLGCERSLYQFVPGNDTPVLLNTAPFPADISTVGNMSVGLNNGQIFQLRSGSWVNVVNEPSLDKINAIALWRGLLDTLHYVYGTDNDSIHEQDQTGSWDDNTLIIPPDIQGVTVARVTSLEQYKNGFIPIPVQLLPANPPPTPNDERLLVGTGDSGVFYVIYVSRLSLAAGAFELSTVEDITGSGVQRPVIVSGG